MQKNRVISCRGFSLELCLPPCENRLLEKKSAANAVNGFHCPSTWLPDPTLPFQPELTSCLFARPHVEYEAGFSSHSIECISLLPTHPPLHFLPSLLVRHDYMLFGLIPFRLLCCIIPYLCAAKRLQRSPSLNQMIEQAEFIKINNSIAWNTALK